MVQARSLQAQNLRLVQEAIDSAIAGMTEEQLAWHPEGKWSSAQILEHLFLVFVNSTKGLNQLLADGRPALRKSTMKERMAVLVTIKIGHIPAGRKAPESVVPKGMNPREVQEAIQDCIIKMDELGKQCEVRFADGGKIFLHPILGPLTLHELFKFHRTHTLHHMRQIQALRQAMPS
ncbi:MAG TPA: DUF1569 domain-containing protein [Candidatus Solibacter sp.]|jgi:hypothetical protein|nr:DUF1569 domain-containing protein [Candidatus Solibacter sp.]